MVDEKLITKKDAVRRIPADSLSHLLAPIFDRKSARAAKKIGSGLAAGPGAACGRVVFSAEEAVMRAEKGEKVVLARIETSPEDLRGMIAAEVATAPSEIVQVLIDRSLDSKKSVVYSEYTKLMKWTDEFRTLGVRTNADTPEQVTNAVAFGAEGIGLCRTEHMFFEGDRID